MTTIWNFNSVAMSDYSKCFITPNKIIVSIWNLIALNILVSTVLKHDIYQKIIEIFNTNSSV